MIDCRTKCKSRNQKVYGGKKWVHVFITWKKTQNVLTMKKNQISLKLKYSIHHKVPLKSIKADSSLVVQWLRICFVTQETWVWSPAREDPSCHGETAHEPQLLNQHSGVHAPQQEKPQQWEAQAPLLDSEPCSPQLEKATERLRLSTTIKKYIN